MKTFKLLLFIVCVFSFVDSNAQEKEISGMVTMFDSIPLIGVSVKINSSKQIVLTDTLGRFTAKVKPEDKLKVSAKGFYSEKIDLNENNQVVLVNLKIKPSKKAVDYAIGYGYVNEKYKTAALSQIENANNSFSNFTNMYDLIRTLPGVYISGKSITIRGKNSFNSSTEPLIVLDGVAVDNNVLDSLSPTTVKSINVIKDGSAAAYGVRGACGVIVIETKRGGDS